MISYKCIGFDIRVWPCDDQFSCETGLWDTNESAIRKISEKIEIKENIYQLFEIEDMKYFNQVKKLALDINDCTLVTFSIPDNIAKFNSEKHRFPTGMEMNDNDMKVCGVDIADINGFFSILNMKELASYRGENFLINEKDYVVIFNAVGLANFLNNGHSPCCPVKLASLRW